MTTAPAPAPAAEAPPGTGATPPTPAPDFPSDEALLADYLDPALTIPQVAADNAISIPDFVAWLRRPHIAEFLEQYEQVCTDRSRRLMAAAGPAAVATTVNCLSAGSRETARRAASALMRVIRTAPLRTSPAAPKSAAGPADTAAPPTRPSPIASPPPPVPRPHPDPMQDPLAPTRIAA